MLLQFMTSIIRQLVINIKNNVLLYPFALHNRLSTGRARRPSLHNLFLRELISYPPGRRAISAWPETAYSLRFLPSYSAPRQPSAISIRDSASTQRPCVRAASTSPAPAKFFRPTRAASGRPQNPLRLAHLLFAPASSGCCPGKDWSQSGKSTYRTNTRTEIARCSCKPSGTLPDKHPGLRVPIPSGAKPDAALPGRTGAPIPRTRRDCRVAPRVPAGCRQCGSDLTCGCALGAAAFHCFARDPHTANLSSHVMVVPLGPFWLPSENTCQPEIVLPTRRPASLCPRFLSCPLFWSDRASRPSSSTPGALTFPGFKKIDGERADS